MQLLTKQPDQIDPSSSGRGLDLFFGADEDETTGQPEAASGITPDTDAAPDASTPQHSMPPAEAADLNEDMPDLTSTTPTTETETPDTTTVNALPVVGVEVTGEAEPPPPPGEPAQPGEAAPPLVVETEKRDDFASGCLQGSLLVLLGAMLGAILALALLYLLNSNLRWSTPADFAVLDENVAALRQNQSGLGARLGEFDTRMGALDGDIQSLHARTEPLTDLPDQVAAARERLTTIDEASSALKLQTQAIQDQIAQLSAGVNAVTGEVDALSGELDAASSQVAELSGSLDTLNGRVERMDDFLIGLNELLDELFAEEIAAATPVSPTAGGMITPSAAVTDTTVSPTLEITATPAADLASVRGLVYVDVNRPGEGRNRRWDDDEPGIAGVTITLYTDNLVRVATTVTDETGAYLFDNLPPGQYIVVQSDLPRYRSSTLNSVTARLRNGSAATVDFGDFPLSP